MTYGDFVTDGFRTSKWLTYLLPTREDEELVLRESGVSSSSPNSPSNTAFRRLLDETSDLIDSPPFSHVLTLLLDASFTVLVHQKLVAQAFKLPPSPLNPAVSDAAPTAPRIIDISEQEAIKGSKTKLANILAVMTRQAHAIGSGVSNEYLDAMEQVRDLEGFAALVYSSNWEFEGSVEHSEASTSSGSGEKASQGSEEAAPQPTTNKAQLLEKVLSPENVSAIDDSEFESAWGKATVRTPE